MRSGPVALLFMLCAVAIVLGVGAWYTLSRQRRRRRLVYQRALEAAVSDGVLTPEELQQLEAIRARGSLTDEDVRMAALAVYRRALAAAVADARVTPDEDATLARMQELLGLTDRDLARDAVHIRRMRVLAQLERGRLPVVDAPLDLPDGEVGHWTVQATACERIAYPGPAPATTANLVFDVGASGPFSAAGERGALGASPRVLPVDLGILVVTGRTLRFKGARTAAEIPLGRLRRIALYRDGLRLDLDEPRVSRYFLVADPELTAAVLLAAARLASQGASGHGGA